jgi:hypothetical protein
MKIIVPLLIASLLTGCATLSNLFASTAVQTAVQAGIDIGVGVVLSKNPAEAAALQVAATALENLAKGSSSSVATLEADADAKIAAMTSLNPPEKLALEQIVTLAAVGLTIGQAALAPTAAVDLAIVFGDIANAAAAYTVVSAKAATMRFR